MNTRKTTQIAFFGLMALALPAALAAQTVIVPGGTSILAEFQHDVRSKQKETATGDIIFTHVAQDVIVNGVVVIEEGAELLLRVEYAKKAKMFGRKGHLHFEAVSVRTVDGESAPLDGSYSRLGTGRKFVTATLAVAVAWPFAFLRGKQASVPKGSIVETRTRRAVEVSPRTRIAGL